MITRQEPLAEAFVRLRARATVWHNKVEQIRRRAEGLPEGDKRVDALAKAALFDEAARGLNAAVVSFSDGLVPDGAAALYARTVNRSRSHDRKHREAGKRHKPRAQSPITLILDPDVLERAFTGLVASADAWRGRAERAVALAQAAGEVEGSHHQAKRLTEEAERLAEVAEEYAFATRNFSEAILRPPLPA